MPELSTEVWIGSALAVITLLLGLGVTLAMDAKTKGEFRFAVSCFLVSAATVVVMIGAWDMNTTEPAVKRIVMTALLFAATGVVLVETIRWTHGRHLRASTVSESKSERNQEPVAVSPTIGEQPPATKKTDSVATLVPIQRTSKFSLMIPFDTKPGAFPIPLDTNPDDPLYRTYRDLYSLAQNGRIPKSIRESKETGQISWNPEPVSIDDSTVFLSRLLQYYILVSIDLLQRDSFTVSVGYPAEAKAGIVPPDAEKYPFEKIDRTLSDNEFFRPFLHRTNSQEQMWRLKPIMMPKGTIISSKQQQGKYFVELKRSGYFSAEFIVESFMGTGPGSVPKDFVTSNPETVMQWSFFVTMDYSIERTHDGFNSDRYSQWLDALYTGLSKKFVLPT